MQKKILRLFMMCICMVMIFGASVGAEETNKYGNLFYNINDGFVKNTGCEEDATEVIIPREIDGVKVTQIENSAFYLKEKLAKIEIPDTIESIDASAFYGTAYYLNPANWEDGILYLGKCLIDSKQDVENVKIKEGTKCIANIENYLNCEYVGVTSNPLTDPSACELYLNKEEITSVTIPNTVKKIPIYAFRHCDKITSITIPESVTSIGNRAFINCLNLSEVDIKNGFKAIGSYAFIGCENLKKVNIPESVTTVEEGAFQQCYSLEDINLPNNITSIESNAFFCVTG